MNKHIVQSICFFIPNKKRRKIIRDTLCCTSVFKDIKYFIKFLLSDITDKRIFIFEPNPFHGECLPSYVKYFIDLGYKVDLCINEPVEKSKVFCRVPKMSGLNFYIFSPLMLDFILNMNKITKYKYVFLTSTENFLYQKFYFDNKQNKIPENSLIMMEHFFPNIEDYNLESYVKNKKLFVIGNHGRNDLPEISPHYFGEVKTENKNKDVTKFISIGGVEIQKQSHQIRLDAIKKLMNKNFKFVVTARGDIGNIPKEYNEYFELLRNVDFKVLYEQIENSDFILPMLSSEFKEQHKYKQYLTSGSKQLSLGFLKPFVIEKDFAVAYGFDDTNAVIYEQGELAKALEFAINMSREEYQKMQDSLKKLADNNYKTSLKNISDALDF